MLILSAKNSVTRDYEKVHGGRGMSKGSTSGLILNDCPGSFVVSDFLLMRSSKWTGAFVVNLQNLPEARRIAPK